MPRNEFGETILYRGVGIPPTPPVAASGAAHSVDDLRRRYEGCFFRAFINGDPSVVSVARIYTDDDTGVLFINLHVYDGNGGRMENYEGPLDTTIIDFSFPDLGAFNTEYGALYISKRVERQWLRGLNSRVLSIHSFEDDESSSGYSLDSGIACNILRPVPGSIREGMDTLMKGTVISYAVNSNVVVTASKNRSEISLYYQTHEIGYVCLLTGDIVLTAPFECLKELILTYNIGEVRMEGL